MNRRKFLSFFGLAALAPIAAKLPADNGVRFVHKSDPIVTEAIRRMRLDMVDKLTHPPVIVDGVSHREMTAYEVSELRKQHLESSAAAMQKIIDQGELEMFDELVKGLS